MTADCRVFLYYEYTVPIQDAPFPLKIAPPHVGI